MDHNPHMYSTNFWFYQRAALSVPRRSMSTTTPMQTPHQRVIFTEIEAIFKKSCGKNGFPNRILIEVSLAAIYVVDMRLIAFSCIVREGKESMLMQQNCTGVGLCVAGGTGDAARERVRGPLVAPPGPAAGPSAAPTPRVAASGAGPPQRPPHGPPP